MTKQLPHPPVTKQGKTKEETNLTEEKPKEGQDQNPTNPTAKASVDTAYAEVATLKATIQTQTDTITQLTTQLNEANKVLEAQEKSKLIGDIMPKSQYKLHELVGLGLDELKAIQTTLNRAAPTGYANVRKLGSDLSDRERGLTIGDCSVVTQKLKEHS